MLEISRPHASTASVPMPSAPMKFLPDGRADWENMWDSFCALAQEGGPPHRGTFLLTQENVDTQTASYQFAQTEIIRGIQAVSGLMATGDTPGWIKVECDTPEMARWLCSAIEQENVQVRCKREHIFLPVGEHFTLKGEIKNVITVVAKTTHYWQVHLSQDVKRILILEEKVRNIKLQLKTWFG